MPGRRVARRRQLRWALFLGFGVAVALVATRAVARRRSAPARVPLALKIGYGGFLGILVPVYWRAYGPSNFLWLSDLALFGTTAALVLEQPLPASMAAVGVLPLEVAWNIDFASGGRLGLAGYMFDQEKPIGLRALSLFHVALPPTLLWMLRRLGYDRRAFWLQTLLVSALLPLTYALTAPEKNVNWVFGPGAEPQHRLPRPVYLALEMMVVPAVAMLPMHAILKRIFDRPADFAHPARTLGGLRR
jgi:hypothetical protein